MRLKLTALLMSVAVPAAAAAADTYTRDEALWSETKAGPRTKLVDVGVPVSAATLTLRALQGFAATGLDNGATYESADRRITATVYIYRPSGASANNALIATTETIRGLWKGNAVTGGDSVVAIGGVPNGAQRRLFENLDPAQINGAERFGTGPLDAVLAVAQAGDWVVKVRVSGPASRRNEVHAAADALLATLRFGKDASVVPAAPDTITECLDATSGVDAKLTGGKTEEAMAASLMVIGGVASASAKSPSVGRALCVMHRSFEGGGGLVVLRPTATPGPPSLMLFGDSGSALSTVPPLAGVVKNSTVMLQRTQDVAMFGPYDRPPSLDQYRGLLRGQAAWLGEPIAVATRDAKGNVSVNVTADTK